jgi:hypothetical protein
MRQGQELSGQAKRNAVLQRHTHAKLAAEKKSGVLYILTNG